LFGCNTQYPQIRPLADIVHSKYALTYLLTYLLIQVLRQIRHALTYGTKQKIGK